MKAYGRLEVQLRGMLRKVAEENLETFKPEQEISGPRLEPTTSII
jgi:hypothetical protein